MAFSRTNPSKDKFCNYFVHYKNSQLYKEPLTLLASSRNLLSLKFCNYIIPKIFPKVKKKKRVFQLSFSIYHHQLFPRSVRVYSSLYSSKKLPSSQQLQQATSSVVSCKEWTHSSHLVFIIIIFLLIFTRRRPIGVSMAITEIFAFILPP